MAGESVGINAKDLNQFNKICLLNSMANQIGYHGVQCGNEKLMDYIDLNCGAIPDGEFAQVIDLNAPYEFLSLYMQIAENRFAFAVTELVKMNVGFKQIIIDYCNTVGRDMNIEAIESVQQAFEIVQSLVLDGMPDNQTKKIEVETSNRIEWVKLTDTHKSAWEKAGGDLSFYYDLQQAFVNGLLTNSHIKFEIKNCSQFILYSE